MIEQKRNFLRNVKNGEAFKTIQYSDARRLELSLKIAFAKRWLDIREWVKFPGESDFKPTRKGLMIDLSVWKYDILPAIQKAIETGVEIA